MEAQPLKPDGKTKNTQGTGKRKREKASTPEHIRIRRVSKLIKMTLSRLILCTIIEFMMCLYLKRQDHNWNVSSFFRNVDRSIWIWKLATFHVILPQYHETQGPSPYIELIQIIIIHHASFLFFSWILFNRIYLTESTFKMRSSKLKEEKLK